MSELQPTKTTRFMREEIRPELPQALEEASLRFIKAGPAALVEYREAALEALRKSGLPHSGSEEFTFIRVNEILPQLSFFPESAADGNSMRTYHVPKTATMPTLDLIRSLVFPESRASYVVLLDGEYSPALSHPGPGFRVGPLEAAETRPGSDQAALSSTLKTTLLASLAREADAAASLAALFAPQPLLIQVEAKAATASPLQVLHLRTTTLALRRDTFLVVAAERLSESRILVRHAGISTGEPDAGASGAMSNIQSLILLDEAASVKWLEAAPEGPADPRGSGDQGGSGNEAEVHFHKLNAVLERDSRLFAVSTSTGARLARNAFAVDLHGPGSEAEINGATVLTGARQAHNFLQLRHLVPHCSSRQHFKTVAADKGRASVDGTVFVAEGAQLTNANQLINNLILSDEARADSKPRLLIHADDVKCTHGATSGKLDPAQQFYLESRGLPAAQARTLMTLAFIAEIVEKADKALGIPGSGFRAHLDATLLGTLKRRLTAAPTAADGKAGAGITGTKEGA